MSLQIFNAINLGNSIDEKISKSIKKTYETNYHKSIDRFENHLKFDLITLSKLISYDLYNLDETELSHKINYYLKLKEWCSIKIISDINNETIVQTNKKKNYLNCKKHTVSITYNNQSIGKMEAYYSTKIIEESFNKNKNSAINSLDKVKIDIRNLTYKSIYEQIFYTLIVLCLLFFILSKHINNSIIKPIDNLLKDMGELTEDSLDNIKPKYAEDNEIGKLNNYFYSHITNLLKKLNKQANYDSLTGLYSRQKLLNDLEENVSFNFALVDINKFKDFNNFLGIKAGDIIIQKIATNLLEFFNNTSYKIYRFNGDEFAILDLKNRAINEFEYSIISFINHIEKKDLIIDKEIVNISLSAGITNCEDTDPIVAATIALKYSKQENENSIIYTKTNPLISEFEKNFYVTKLVRKAINKNLILPHYQPIQNIKENSIMKYESLMRIQDNKDNIYYPDSFLDIAHKAGLYKELSLKMIKKVIKYSKNNDDLSFTINLSTKDILDKKLLKFLDQLKTDTNSMKNIVFEITEQDGIENFDEIECFIGDVKKYGAKIAIDDFGSGYSNFENIIHLGIDYLKIDGSLIKNIVTDKNSRIIVETIVQFSNKLGIETIAEYVSDKDIYKVVKDIGIDYAQGYYIGKPSIKLLGE
ncbi:MAG: bifunctional diguanylate cyclase/phosphodiesterase [Campylobacterota bacterium]|nr:bifunctional diguanylate cyclase/phosphodiesterase [Campylobacterota bacterium]